MRADRLDTRSLIADRRSLPTLDLADGGGQLEGLVHVDAGGVLRRPRVVAEELLQQRLRNGDAGDLAPIQLEAADAVLRRQRAGGGDRQPARQVAERIGPGRASSACAPRRDRPSARPVTRPLPARVQLGIDDADGHLGAGEELEVGVDLVVGDLRRARGFALAAACAAFFSIRELGLELRRRPASTSAACARERDEPSDAARPERQRAR